MASRRYWYALAVVFTICSSCVIADYECVCNYAVERPVYGQHNENAAAVGYMYEFDCKPLVKQPAPNGWLVIAYDHQVSYVTRDQLVTTQVCPGQPSASDLLTTPPPSATTEHHTRPITTTTTPSPTTITTTTTIKTTTTATITTPTPTTASTTTTKTTTPTRTTSQTTTTSTTITTPKPSDTPTTIRTTTPDAITTRTITTVTTTPKPTTSTITTSITPTPTTPITTPKTTTTTITITTPKPTTTTTPIPTTTTTTPKPTTTSIPTTTTPNPTTPTTTPKPTTTTILPTTITTTPKPTTPTTNPKPTTTSIPTTTTTTEPSMKNQPGLCSAAVHTYTQQEQGALTQYGNHCYQLVPHKLTWTMAELDCRAKGGNLVRLMGVGIQTYIYYWVHSFRFTSPIWLGLHGSSEYHWVTGDSLKYSNWYPGSPGMQHENCALMKPTGPFYGKWEVEDCASASVTNAFICEYRTSNDEIIG